MWRSRRFLIFDTKMFNHYRKYLNTVCKKGSRWAGSAIKKYGGFNTSCMAVSLKRKPFSWSAHFNPRPVVNPKMVLVPRKLPSTITSSLSDAIVYCTTIRKIGFLLMSFPSKSNLSFPLSVLSVYFNLLTYSLKNDANMFIHFCVYKYILRFCKNDIYSGWL